MIKTKRLLLRPWTKEDFVPFAKMSQDPRVMEFFPKLLTKEESEEAATRYKSHIDQKGWGLWAVEIPNEASFIGFVGLSPVKLFTPPFEESVEIGWRLAHAYWGKGFATEGAKAALSYGFHTLHLPEIVAFTAKINLRSQNVMKKLGMHHNPQEDFLHPKVPEGHLVQSHVLYRLCRDECIF